MLFSYLLLPLLPAAVKIPLVEIAKDVEMPVMSIGIGGTESSNASEIVANWLKQGGRGIDTALVYGDQQVLPQELRKANLSRKEVFITTKRRGQAFKGAGVAF